MSITDTIDKAIRDYGLGPDAMRWAPEDPDGDLPRHAIVTFSPGVVVRFDFEVGAFVEAMEHARSAMRGIGTTLQVWFDEPRQWERERRARLRRLHSAHPAKWRKAR